MKRMPDDDFLNPLRNRPGLKPRLEFKHELKDKLQNIEIKKHRFQIIKAPTLVGLAFLLIFLIFSNDILTQLNLSNGNTTVQDKGQEKPIDSPVTIEDIIKWNGSIYFNKNDGSEVITGDLIGMKLGAINKKVSKNREAIKDGEATRVEEGTMVYSVGNTEDIAIKRNDQWIMYRIEENRVDYLSKNEAIEIAKKYAQTDIISFDAEFIKQPSDLDITELESHLNPIWKVIGLFQMGNKEIIYIDSQTGDLLGIGEQEREGFGEGVDSSIELIELKDSLDETSYIYKGDVLLSFSEEAKAELKSGSALVVNLSGEMSSIYSEPTYVEEPNNQISIPFEFDLDSDKLTHKMIGNMKLFIEIRNQKNDTVYSKEIKAFSVE